MCNSQGVWYKQPEGSIDRGDEAQLILPAQSARIFPAGIVGEFCAKDKWLIDMGISARTMYGGPKARFIWHR